MNAHTRRRLYLVAALLVGATGLSAVMFSSMGDNLVYFWDAKELVQAGDDAIGATVRLGGLVQADSVDWNADDRDLSFQITDSSGEYTVPVHAKAAPPQMFREGIGVVVEGELQPDGIFECDRVMVKHSNEYRAPTDGEDVKELYTTLEEEF